MEGKNKKVVISAILFFAGVVSLAAQSSAKQDSLVRLMQAESLELQEKYGQKYRKSKNPTFLHNGTYLICDSAVWNVNLQVINCEGHVQLMQGDAILKSDRLDYLIDEDLARFRGEIIELRNKENNVLRTKWLDYNTRDSVAVFKNGASMKDKDGKVIESIEGNYRTAQKKFTFLHDVNMFSDSVFVKTDSLEYDSAADRANFISHLDFWKDGNMLSSDSGWYDNRAGVFLFTDSVHALGETQEAWCDSLYYYRDSRNILLLSNAQLQDTSRNVAAMADRIFYEDTLSRITMNNDAAVAVITGEQDRRDTLYIGADTLVYRTFRYCDIPATEISSAKARFDEIMFDPVEEYRRKAAEAAAEEMRKAAESDANIAGALRAKGKLGKPSLPPKNKPSQSDSTQTGVLKDTLALADSLALRDSLSVTDSLSVPDSLAVTDSLAAPDTTRYGFIYGRHNVRLYRHDMQVRCDSLLYNDLDSIARLYIDPVIWNEGNRQYSSDSLQVLVRGGKVDRASLMSDAFIITQEDSICYNQIKATDVIAYFDSTSALSRFDALGGALAMFFLKENDVYATVNKVDCKMISASLSDGDLERVYYFDSPKNDALPIAQLESSDFRMKGFNWTPENRPAGKEDITSQTLRPCEREDYEAHPRTRFKYTEQYFPGYMGSIYQEIDERKRQHPSEEPAEIAEEEPSPSVGETPDKSSATAETSAAPADTAAPAVPTAPVDTLTSKDTLAVSVGKRELREQRRKQRWAALDAKDAAKAEAKAAKIAERKRRAYERALAKQRRQDAKDEAKLQKYIKRFEKQKARHAKEKPEPAGELPQGT